MLDDHKNELWTELEVAKYLHWNPGTLRRKRASGDPDQPPYLKLGGSIRYRKEDVERWLESRLVTPTAVAV